jgi:hypothetical protein
MKAQLVFIIGLIITSSAFGVSTVPECQNRPEFLTQGRTLPNLKALPSFVYIGKRADYYIENKATGLKIWGEQSFLRGESKIVCASAGRDQSQSYSMYAPTLIDLSKDKSLGESYWQFHVIANAKQFGIWNKASRVFSKNKDLESGLAKIGAQVQFVQLSHSEYQFVFTRETDQTLETLVIRFDAIPNLP